MLLKWWCEALEFKLQFHKKAKNLLWSNKFKWSFKYYVIDLRSFSPQNNRAWYPKAFWWAPREFGNLWNCVTACGSHFGGGLVCSFTLLTLHFAIPVFPPSPHSRVILIKTIPKETRITPKNVKHLSGKDRLGFGSGKTSCSFSKWWSQLACLKRKLLVPTINFLQGIRRDRKGLGWSSGRAFA
jgi:hypothetical protein